jgi:anthranilate synthase/aminodeoxychorismate synthase-like glutamine amidotransferase
MLLLIDNYDSFTYNLAQYLGELGVEIKIVRNDQFELADVERWAPERIVVSPGPCTPHEAGLSVAVIKKYGASIPLLGVCLGHQSIGAAYGGIVERAPELQHGKTSMIHHDGEALFEGLGNPFEATRYHSLIVRREGLPECLIKTAWTDDDLIMGLRHVEHPVYGVQFHPESVLTGEGKRMLKNFLEIGV